MKRFLLVNPWIHDFTAFDFWAKPLGLLLLASWLRKNGKEATILDLVDPLSPLIPDGLRPARRADGSGRFLREAVSRPRELPDIGRKYCRYGARPDDAARFCKNLPRPDAVLVGSMMTYWYPGVFETIDFVKRIWPGVPVFLGGVYATLCSDHAREHSGADALLCGPLEDHEADWASPLNLLVPLPASPFPEPDLTPWIDAAPLLTSRGCPNRCGYCGVARLYPGYTEHAISEVLAWVRTVTARGIRNLALYDDAFLANADRARAILSGMATMRGPAVHAASGMACRHLNREMAKALHAARFRTVRLGFETADESLQRRTGGKVTTSEFERAVEHLLSAGFSEDSIGAYILVGLPEQSLESVERSIEAVRNTGIRPHLAEYSPVPGSPFFERSRKNSPFDLSEPLFHNPTLLPCGGPELDRAAVHRLKLAIRNRG